MLIPYLKIKKQIAIKFLYALNLLPEKRSAHSRGERSISKEVALEIAEIALTLNPYRKAKKDLTFLKELETMYKA